MPTFKAVVQKHQERRDGKFPVSIRVTHNRKSAYLPTGLYCSHSQINKRTFEIKDQFILVRTGQTIRSYEATLLEIDTEALFAMSAHDLCAYFRKGAQEIDFLAYCRSMIASNPKRYHCLRSALRVIDSMGITKMTATEFTSAFLQRFKDYLSTGYPQGIHKVSTRCRLNQAKDKIEPPQLSENTQSQYFNQLCMAFRRMKKEYNTEFHKVITHDPFVNIEAYHPTVTAKRSLTDRQLRQFFSLTAHNDREQIAIDMVKISFGMCGINLFDLQRLEWANYDEQEQRVFFVRHKTEGKSGNRVAIAIRIEPEVMAIAEKYKTSKGSRYLFNFGNKEPDIDYSLFVYRHLQAACKRNGTDAFTPYQFRHTWATIARNQCEVSKDDIDLCLAHVGSNPMADVYIRPDYGRIDRANRKVMDYVLELLQKKD